MPLLRTQNIAAVWRKELLDLVRDKRTMMSMIVIPIVMMPLLLVGVGAVMASAIQKLESRTLTVATIHPERSSRLQDSLRTIRGLELIDLSGLHLDSLRAMVQRSDLHAAIVFPEQDLADPQTRPPVTVLFRGDREQSSQAMSRIGKKLVGMQEALTLERLALYNAPESVIRPFEIVEENLSSAEQEALSALAGFLPYMLIIFTLIGAMYPAIDMTAGEKERGTLETLLASPAGRTEIVLGKFLAVLTTSVISASLSLLSLLAMLTFGTTLIGVQMGESMTLSFPPVAILSALAMMIPLAALFSSLLLTICMFAKSTREAQSYVQPLMIVIILPAMMAMMPGSEGSGGSAWTPVVNVSLALKGILVGQADPGFLGQTVLATAIYAAIGIAITVKNFQRENVLFRV